MEGSGERTDNASQAEGAACTEGKQSECSLVSKWADVGSGMWPYWEEVQCGHAGS